MYDILYIIDHVKCLCVYWIIQKLINLPIRYAAFPVAASRMTLGCSAISPGLRRIFSIHSDKTLIR